MRRNHWCDSSYGCFLLLLTGCGPQPVDPSNLVNAVRTNEFLPIDPIPSHEITFVDPATGGAVTRAWSTLAPDRILQLLPNQRAQITISRVDASGELKYATAGLATETGSYRVVMDYSQFTTDGLMDYATGMDLGTGRVGVGLRIKVEIVTTKSNLDLGSLIAIGVAARMGYVRGTLDIQVMGMNSPDITMLFPTPSQIDETSIQRALEAMAAIKAKVADANTTLSPQIIAWRPRDTTALQAAWLRLQ